jgi:hypothetical protein
MKLRVLQNTWFKQSTKDSAQLPPTDKVAVTAGQEFTIHSWKSVDRNHLKIALLGSSLGNPARNTWFVFMPHVRLIDRRGNPPVSPRPPAVPIRLPNLGLPATKNLGVPHRSQLDNAENPTGACNVTCFAMVMRYFKIRQRTNAVQMEDELYRYMENQGLSRHDPGDLAQLARAYGLKDELTLQGRLADIRKAIAEGKPCIIHGYYTSFGHIIVVRGYDKSGFFVNDPYGEWTASGYRKDLSGENLHYSTGLVQSKSSPEGPNFIWLHRLSKV